MGIKEDILALIKKEDVKNPLTDEELSRILSTSRETVTLLRKQLGIPNSSQRREAVLSQRIMAILEKDPKISVSELTRMLVGEGFRVSRTAVINVLKKLKIKKKKENSKGDPFENLIGCDGSLKPCITQAKAAILYPDFGLPTLIVGESGTGKTQFAELMYLFAKKSGVLMENAPFVTFNCADYSDNPQLLLSLLYGYKKGAFTGAEENREGIVEQANGGVLFLDEIHRLPPQGQEILFSILDRGKFRRLGETDTERSVNFLFIGATTEDINSKLLVSFRRRIPIVISLPSLENRPFVEKIELIKYFFLQECRRINQKLVLESKAVELLASKRYQGNVGELKSVIQVSCAKAYIRYINNKSHFDGAVFVRAEDVPVDRGFPEKPVIFSDEQRKFITSMSFSPNDDEGKTERQTKIEAATDIYEEIERKFQELQSLNIDSRNIEEILWHFINKKFNEINIKDISFDKLVSFVDSDIIELIRTLEKKLESEFPYRELNKNALVHLAIHLEESIKRIKANEPIINPNLNKIKVEFPTEYRLAQDFVKIVEQKKDVKIPEDETGFITMYIKTTLNAPSSKRVGIILVSHGRIATETANVVKKLLNVDFVTAIDMPLDEHPSAVYDKAVEIARIVDEGKGILFLVDMGSLVNIGDVVAKRLGIYTRTIDRMDLVTALEAVHKASIPENTLDDIYYSLINSRNTVNVSQNENMPPAVIAMCLTGAGLADRIELTIKDKFPQLEVFKMGFFDVNFPDKVKELQNQYKIAAIVGTINPEIPGISFIPYDGAFLNKLAAVIHLSSSEYRHSYFEDFFLDELIMINPNFNSKKDIITNMCTLLEERGYVKKEFLQSVLEREEMLATYFKGGIAIPHGDPRFVLRSAGVLVRLKEPIDWGVGKVKLVLLVALKYNDQKLARRLVKIFLNADTVDRLYQCESKESIKKLILSLLRG